MPNSNDFVNYVSELLAPAGHVLTKRMFGGHGLYLDGLFMAIIVDDALYLKTDEVTRAAFDAESCVPFVFAKDGKDMVTSYRRAPDDAMDAPHLMLPWAKRALDAALRARAAQPTARKKQAEKPVAKPAKKKAAKKKSSRPAIKKRRK